MLENASERTFLDGCGRLKNWPPFSTHLIHSLCKVTLLFSSTQGDYFLYTLNLNWLCAVLWPLEWAESDCVSQPSLDLQRPHFCSLLVRTPLYERSSLACGRMKDQACQPWVSPIIRIWESPAKQSSKPSFSWLRSDHGHMKAARPRTHESSSQDQKHLVEPSPNFWLAMREINGCFKLLSFGVVGYPAKTNWNFG